MLNNPLQVLVSAFLFVSIDFAYLKLMKKYFSNQVKVVQGSTIKMDLLATFFCYIFLIFGLNYFIIKRKRSVLDAFLLGLVIYGVYETTTKALFHKWSWITVLIDTLWGGILFALITYIISLMR